MTSRPRRRRLVVTILVGLVAAGLVGLVWGDTLRIAWFVASRANAHDALSPAKDAWQARLPPDADGEVGRLVAADGAAIDYWFLSHHRLSKVGTSLIAWRDPDGSLHMSDTSHCCEVWVDARPQDRRELVEALWLEAGRPEAGR